MVTRGVHRPAGRAHVAAAEPERTRAGLLREVEKARDYLREHGADSTKRPETAGKLIALQRYAQRIPGGAGDMVTASLTDAARTFTTNRHGIDQVDRALTAAMEHLSAPEVAR